jgi:hypothetical protein
MVINSHEGRPIIFRLLNFCRGVEPQAHGIIMSQEPIIPQAHKVINSQEGLV